MRSVAAVLIIGTAGLVGCRCGAPPQSSAPRPNVLLVSIDTLRADHVGCYGYSRPTTPVLDGLAARGVRFTNAFSPASWTLPAHMSLMTSLYPHVHGVERSHQRLAPSARTLAEVLSASGYRTAGFVSWFFVSRKYGINQGFDTWVELLPQGEDLDDSSPASAVIDAVGNWIRREATAPFFLFVHLFDPHMHYAPPAPYDTMFDADYAGAIDGTYDSLQPYIKGLRPNSAMIDDRDREHVIALYDGEIRYADDQLGRLLSLLDARAWLDETIVVVTSDHGEEFFDHGSMEGHQWTLYEEVTRVPLILVLPGDDPPSEVDALIDLTDVAPTLLDRLGIGVPPAFQGRSLLPWVESGMGDPRDAVFSEIKRFNERWAVRTRTHKLIYSRGLVNPFGVPVEQRFELYDLRDDSRERVDLFDEKDANAQRLAHLLDAWTRGGPPTAPPEDVVFSEEERERLRSLGYVE